jgi:hypothetical protein
MFRTGVLCHEWWGTEAYGGFAASSMGARTVGPSRDWLKVKNPDSPAMIRAREAEWCKFDSKPRDDAHSKETWRRYDAFPS